MKMLLIFFIMYVVEIFQYHLVIQKKRKERMRIMMNIKNLNKLDYIKNLNKKLEELVMNVILLFYLKFVQFIY